MHIKIETNGLVSLQDSENFKAFSIVEESPGIALEALGDRVVEFDQGHVWLQAEAVIELAGPGADDAWVERFWNMLEQVEPYGYSDMKTKRVRAHIE